MAGVVFLGSKDIGLSVLQTLIETIGADGVSGVMCADDRQDTRSEMPAFQVLARECDMPFAHGNTAAELLETVNRWSPSTVIVSGWYRRIPVEQFPATRFFGFHASPLPRYRGGAPLVWQIIRGEPEIGVSMFELVARLDEGGIVEQRMSPFAVEETIADALEWARAECAEMTGRNIGRIIDGSVTLTSQDPSAATYCSQRLPADGLIDWRSSANEVHDFVRAQTRPYPGAFTRTSSGPLVRIWSTEVDGRSYLGPPGAVVERGEDHVVVTCGSGAIRVTDAVIDGEQVQPVDRLLGDLKTRFA